MVNRGRCRHVPGIALYMSDVKFDNLGHYSRDEMFVQEMHRMFGGNVSMLIAARNHATNPARKAMAERFHSLINVTGLPHVIFENLSTPACFDIIAQKSSPWTGGCAAADTVRISAYTRCGLVDAGLEAVHPVLEPITSPSLPTNSHHRSHLKHYSKQYPYPKPQSGTVLVIERKHSRAFLPEAMGEMLGALRAQNFRVATVRLEDLEYCQQVRAFADNQFIIAAHWSAVAGNLALLSDRAYMLELQPVHGGFYPDRERVGQAMGRGHVALRVLAGVNGTRHRTGHCSSREGFHSDPACFLDIPKATTIPKILRGIEACLLQGHLTFARSKSLCTCLAQAWGFPPCQVGICEELCS